MWTHDDARHVVQAYVDVVTEGTGVIVDEMTLDRPYGWVFFYQSRAYLENGHHADELFGNAPVIFNRVAGEYTITGTAHTTEYYLEEYERSLPSYQLEMPPQIRERPAKR